MLMTDEEIQNAASDLAQKMQKAVEEDNINNIKRLPAIKKYLLLDEVSR